MMFDLLWLQTSPGLEECMQSRPPLQLDLTGPKPTTYDPPATLPWETSSPSYTMRPKTQPERGKATTVHMLTDKYGEQRWHSGESTCLPPMWPRLKSWCQHHNYVGWVCCWFSPLLREVFLSVPQFSPLLKNQHFPQFDQEWWTKNHYLSGLPLNLLLLLLLLLLTFFTHALVLFYTFLKYKNRFYICSKYVHIQECTKHFDFTEKSLPIYTILRIQSNASMLTQNVKQHSYSWTSLQQPPWEWQKVAIVKDGCCREFLNKGQCADFLSAGTKKGGRCREVTIVERWQLAEVRLYFTLIESILP